MYPEAPVRVASAGDPASLDRALSGAAVVINCAGPFANTAPPVMDAALRAGVHYLDVTAEQAVALHAFERLADRACDRVRARHLRGHRPRRRGGGRPDPGRPVHLGRSGRLG